jgi:CheY-like chemotaxis protein
MGKRILVADDSLTIQQAVAMVMEGSGYALSFAKSVDEALVVVKKDGRPDLVLADVAIGNGSGYDLCAELKADSSMRDIPVFILASSQSPYDEARGRKVGADGYMAKPFESQALLDAVAMAMVSPARPPASAMPEFTDHDDNTARITAGDLPTEDDDSYGEIVIERGAAPTPPAPAWGTKPPTRPSGPRAAVSPTPPPAQTSPRPSLIPGARPSASMPTARTPQPAAPVTAPPSAAPAAARPAVGRTMMGFPSVKPPVVAAPKPQIPAPPVPPRPMTAAPTAPAPAPVPVPTPVRAPMVATPSVPSAPVASRVPTAAGPAMPVPSFTGARPVVPRFSPPPATAPIVVPSPAARRIPTPIPPAPQPASVGTAPLPTMAAAVSSIVEQKVAALAARGPEYEAIAKLSREIIEQVVWEVVPELAESIIRQEIDRLAAAKK